MFLSYVSAQERALIDRELYLPVSWTHDRQRCAQAGIDQEMAFATKPELAKHMLQPLLDTGATTIGWFTADEAYGDNPGLRTWLEDHALNYVMAVSCDHRFTTTTGPARADELAAARLERAGSASAATVALRRRASSPCTKQGKQTPSGTPENPNKPDI